MAQGDHQTEQAQTFATQASGERVWPVAELACDLTNPYPGLRRKPAIACQGVRDGRRRHSGGSGNISDRCARGVLHGMDGVGVCGGAKRALCSLSNDEHPRPVRALTEGFNGRATGQYLAKRF